MEILLKFQRIKFLIMIFTGGFPCQAFSQAGLKKGFSDTRGTLFFDIWRILLAKRPKAFLLENVKQLQTHDHGKTFDTIVKLLEGKSCNVLDDSILTSKRSKKTIFSKLNYHVFYKVLRAAEFGVPQNRERIFIVGFNRIFLKKTLILKKF